MGIVFSPGASPRKKQIVHDMRVALATNLSLAKKQSRRTRSVGVDFRICFRVVGADGFAVSDGDRVTLVLEDDGSWIINNVGPSGDGYVVRAALSKRNKGGVQFRISMTLPQALDLFDGRQEGME